MKLEERADVSVALALQLEGQAIMANVSVEEYLQEMLDKFGHKTFKLERTKKLQEYIRKRHAEGATDTDIAREKGITQQAVSRQRRNMGLPPQPRRAWNRGKCVRLSPKKGEK